MSDNLVRRGGIYHFRAVVGGKRVTRTTGFHDRQRARRRAHEIEDELRSDVLWPKPAVVPTFDAWVKQVVPHTIKRPVKYWGLKSARDLWGSRRLDQVTPLDAEQYAPARIAAGAKVGTVGKEVGYLSSVFRAAVRQGLIARSPFDGVKRPRGQARTRILTLDEEQKLRAHLAPQWDRFVTVGLGTGLRPSEQLALRPCDVYDNLIHVEHSKTGKPRVIPVRPEVRIALMQQAPKSPEQRYWPLTYSTVRGIFMEAGRQAKIPKFGLHDLRRSFATRCADAGLLLPHLQKILGHSSPTMTMQFYIHLEQQSLSDAMKRITLPMVSGAARRAS